MSVAALLLSIHYLIIGAYVDAQEGQAALDLFRRSFDWSNRVSVQICIDGTYNNGQLARKDETTLNNDNYERLAQKHQVSFTNPQTGKYAVEDQRTFVYLKQQSLAVERRVMPDPRRPTDHAYAFENAEDMSRYLAADFSRGGFFLGTVSGFSRQSLPDLLAKSTSLKTSRETYNGSESLVLEGEVPEGIITVWLAPDSGAVQKCQVVKEAGKHLDQHGQLYAYSFSNNGVESNVTRSVSTFTLEDSAEQDGFVIPTAYQYTQSIEFPGGKLDTAVCKLTATNVGLNPDFSSTNAFALPVPDGTSVQYQTKDGTELQGFQLRGGKIIAQVHPEQLNAIRETVNAIAKPDRLGSVEPAVTPVAGERVPAPPKSSARKSVVILGSLLICASIAIVVLGALRQRKQKSSATHLRRRGPNKCAGTYNHR